MDPKRSVITDPFPSNYLCICVFWEFAGRNILCVLPGLLLFLLFTSRRQLLSCYQVRVEGVMLEAVHEF